MDDSKFYNWLLSLRGRSRWELINQGTAFYFSDEVILEYDVYDDYLIFQMVNGKTWEASPIRQILITDFNEIGDLRRFADTLESYIESYA